MSEPQGGYLQFLQIFALTPCIFSFSCLWQGQWHLRKRQRVGGRSVCLFKRHAGWKL